MDIIVEIFVFCGYIPVLWILSIFHKNMNVPWIFSTFHEYICTLWILSAFHGYCPHFVDAMEIGHITSYLACNACDFLHKYILVIQLIFVHVCCIIYVVYFRVVFFVLNVLHCIESTSLSATGSSAVYIVRVLVRLYRQKFISY